MDLLVSLTKTNLIVREQQIPAEYVAWPARGKEADLPRKPIPKQAKTHLDLYVVEEVVVNRAAQGACASLFSCPYILDAEKLGDFRTENRNA
jgi:hypothetical protein